jgi:hypothetical protein
MGRLIISTTGYNRHKGRLIISTTGYNRHKVQSYRIDRFNTQDKSMHTIPKKLLKSYQI